MITFKKIKMQNFLSVGDKPVELTLDTHGITSISGENGSAKSAVCIDSIFYALYGKSFRHANLPRMVNSINKKGMLVEIEFEASGNRCRVVRGIKPNVFEIWINGKMKEQTASAKDYQAYLVKHVLKMDERTFRQVVVIGSSSYVPFMSLSAADRRTVVEQLLSLDLFESLNAAAKDRMREASDAKWRLEEEKSKLDIQAEMQRKHTKENVERLLKQLQDCDAEGKSLEASLDEARKKLKKAMESLDRRAYEEAKERKAKFDDALKKGGEWRAKQKYRLSERRKMRDFLEGNDICPTCSQKIEPDFVKRKLNEIRRLDEESEAEMQSFDEKWNRIAEQAEGVKAYLAEVSKKSAEINRLVADRESVERSIAFLGRQKDGIERQIDEERRALASDAGGLDVQIEEAEKNLRKCIDEIEVLDFLASEFKDSGVKARVISTHLPVINQLVRKYLGIVGFEVGFKFDEMFNESISSAKGSGDVEYANYSEGEKLRINCAILFAFRELAKLRSSISTNILVLDEFDQGTLDEDGFASVVNILKSCESQNIFVISHSTAEFDQIADRSLVARKVNGFSELSEN